MARHNTLLMPTDVRKKFSKRLKELRLRADYSISDLAKSSGVSRQHIRDLELKYPHKRATIVTLEKLAKGLKIPAWKLLQFDNE